MNKEIKRSDNLNKIWSGHRAPELTKDCNLKAQPLLAILILFCNFAKNIII